MALYVVTPDIESNRLSVPNNVAMIARLRAISGDENLTLIRLEEGSVRLVLEGTREGYERIEALFRSGRLTEELGIAVTDVSWLGTQSEAETLPRSQDTARPLTARDLVSHRIRILFLSANPSGTRALQLDEEIRQITNKLRAAEYRESIELISRWAVRPDDLLQALLEHRPHIVHFSGHGTHTQEILLNDPQGNPKPVSKYALISLFTTLKDNVRIVLLNACSTRPQAEAIAQIVDCVIGMNNPIGDDAAIVFAASFYQALGFGRSVKEAFDLGRTALLLEGIPEEKTPELLTRKGINASSVFLSMTR
jgi:hypothetical protein